ERLTQVQEVVGLQQLVAELGVADAAVALHAGLHGGLGDHAADRQRCSDVAEKIEEADRRDPVGVVHEAGGVGGDLEVEQAGQLRLDAGDVVGELFAGEEIALGGAAGGIADHAGGAAGEGDDVVAGELEATQHQLPHEVPDVKRVAGRVEAAIQRHRSLAQALGERVKVGAIGQQAAPLEVF